MSASSSLPSAASTLLLTLVAVVAFAANSVLCRLALGEGLIDAASFATVRVMAGALILVVLMTPRWRAHGRRPADWVTASMLFTYMVFFSFAYLSLGVAAGALVILLYTAFGGFLAVSWTDLVQGLLMLTALVAAAFMALGNVVISYTNYWQGIVAEKIDYAMVLYVDALLIIPPLLLIPFLRTREEELQPATSS